MTAHDAGAAAAAEGAGASPSGGGRGRAVLAHPWAPALAAVGTWLVIALAGLGLSRPLAERALTAGVQTLPLAVGVGLTLALALVLAWRRPGPWAAAVVLGAVAGWVSLLVLITLAGTPYGISSVYGDCGRTAAAAARYTVDWRSADQFIAGLPSQYPPLYFWVWGRGAALLGKGAWQVMGVYQGFALGAGVLVAGLLWRLVLPWWRATFAAALTTGALFLGAGWDPCKGHELTAMLTTVPLLVAATMAVDRVTRDGRRRLSWAVGWGALTGLLFMTYQLGVLFGLPALVVLWVVLAVRRHQVGATALHVVVAGATALVVASPYLVPFAAALLGDRPAARASDPLMVLTSLSTPPGVPIGAGPVTALLVVLGAALIALLWRRPPAPALAALVAGALAVQLLALVNIVRGGESFYSYRTFPWLLVVTTAAVATLAPTAAAVRAGRALAPAARPDDLRRAGVVLLALATLAGVHLGWARTHVPVPGLEQPVDGYSTAEAKTPSARAYLTPMPGCGTVPGLPEGIPTFSCYPATFVDRCIAEQWGPDALPVLLAYDDRAAIFRPNYLLLGTNGGATGPLDEWTQRYAFVKELAATTGAADFARKARSGPFGPVEGFVLGRQRDGTLRWTAQLYLAKGPVVFRPEQFSPADWTTCRRGDVVVLLDRSATPRTTG